MSTFGFCTTKAAGDYPWGYSISEIGCLVVFEKEHGQHKSED